MRQSLGGREELPCDWETIAEAVRENVKKTSGVLSGQRKEDKEICWRNEEVQGSNHRERLAKKKCYSEKDEESRQKN